MNDVISCAGPLTLAFLPVVQVGNSNFPITENLDGLVFGTVSYRILGQKAPGFQGNLTRIEVIERGEIP